MGRGEDMIKHDKLSQVIDPGFTCYEELLQASKQNTIIISPKKWARGYLHKKYEFLTNIWKKMFNLNDKQININKNIEMAF